MVTRIYTILETAQLQECLIVNDGHLPRNQPLEYVKSGDMNDTADAEMYRC